MSLNVERLLSANHSDMKANERTWYLEEGEEKKTTRILCQSANILQCMSWLNRQFICMPLTKATQKYYNLYSCIYNDLFVLCVQWRNSSVNCSQNKEFDLEWILCYKMNCYPKINSLCRSVFTTVPGHNNIFWIDIKLNFTAGTGTSIN